MANYEPCSICEEYIAGVICDKDKCPVALMKNDFEKALKTIDGLLAGQKTLIEEAKTAESEAIKEFVDKMEEKTFPMLTSATLEKKEVIYHFLDILNEVKTEMVGDDNATH